MASACVDGGGVSEFLMGHVVVHSSRRWAKHSNIIFKIVYQNKSRKSFVVQHDAAGDMTVSHL